MEMVEMATNINIYQFPWAARLPHVCFPPVQSGKVFYLQLWRWKAVYKLSGTTASICRFPIIRYTSDPMDPSALIWLEWWHKLDLEMHDLDWILCRA